MNLAQPAGGTGASTDTPVRPDKHGRWGNGRKEGAKARKSAGAGVGRRGPAAPFTGVGGQKRKARKEGRKLILADAEMASEIRGRRVRFGLPLRKSQKLRKTVKTRPAAGIGRFAGGSRPFLAAICVKRSHGVVREHSW